MKEKRAQLKKIYDAFDADTRDMVKGSACSRGCSFCCRQAGSIDITTLEGMAIRKAMEKMPKSRQKTLTKAFRNEIKQREEGNAAPCPFLMKNNACMIYENRPFSCRRIYSAHVCTQDAPPTVSRQVMDRADQTIAALQKLDDTGYSGHLSYILYMLSVPAFLNTYMAGDFKPEEIMEFGKAHRIVINRMMV
nr:YkgJ family cysteine cluster protein [uncultured Desulfobacter sp.]